MDRDMQNDYIKERNIEQNNKVLFWLRVCVFVDFFGVALIVPLLTTYFRAAGVDNAMVGYISSLYYFCQLLGGIVIGFLSDVLPRRDVLMLSFLGSAISYFVVGHSSSISILFASRAMVGLVKQTMTIGNAMVSELGSEKERAANIARLHASNTLAFIVGPAVGSALYKLNSKYPSICSASLFILNICISYFKLPREVPQLKNIGSPSHISITQKLSLIYESINAQQIIIQMVILFLILFVERSTSVSNMVSYYEIRYNVEPYTLGFISSATSIIAYLTQQYGVQIIKKMFNTELRTITICLFITAVANFCEYFCSTIYEYFAFVAIITICCSNTISACSKSAISSTVSTEHVGKLFGALNILDAVAGVAAPIYGSQLFIRTGYIFKPVASAAHYLLLALLVLFVQYRQDKKND